MTIALFALSFVVLFIIFASLARSNKGNRPYVNGKLQSVRAEYLSGKSVDKRPRQYRGRH